MFDFLAARLTSTLCGTIYLVLVVGAAVSSWLEHQCSSGKQGNRWLGNAFFNGSRLTPANEWLGCQRATDDALFHKKQIIQPKWQKYPFWGRSNDSSGESALDKHKLIASYQALNV